MRIDDACLVISNVDVSDAFYSEAMGLERRMRNVRFADFEFAEGPRLAMWMRPSIAETVGETFPAGPGKPFRLTLALASVTNNDTADPRGGELSTEQSVQKTVVADPDGFLLQLQPALDGITRMSAIELSVTDAHATAEFLTALGFSATLVGDGYVEFATDHVVLTIREGRLSQGSSPRALPESTGRLMLAIELDTGEDVDRLFLELKARGLRDSGPPRVYEWGARSAYFVDHDGYIWEIYAWVETPR